MVVEVKQMSAKDRLERKKYMGVWRTQNGHIKMKLHRRLTNLNLVVITTTWHKATIHKFQNLFFWDYQMTQNC
eukprot:bmy_02669T0